MHNRRIEFRRLSSTKHSALKNRSFYAVLGALSVFFTASSVQAADSFALTYGLLEVTIKVSSLENFAKEGKTDKDLDFFLSKATPEQQAQYRAALLQKLEIDPVQLSRFFYSPTGEALLTRIGSIVNLQGGLNGKLGIRSALIQAAFDRKEGLTLLNLFKKFPTNIRFRGEQMMALSDSIGQLINATTLFSENLKQLSSQEAASAVATDFSKLPDLRLPGAFGVQKKQTWLLNDVSRDRKFYVDVYRPQRSTTTKTPVLVFSHGLASRPEDFGDRAEHWASYGYVVVLPQHPGSDSKQAQALLTGLSSKLFETEEFINRPKDLSYVIDELERRNKSEFQGKLNLGSVGVEGHSLGGYAALALAGAEIDFDNLQKDCDRQFGGLNLSLFVQCRALNLSRQAYTFRDRRVGAVLAANPIDSSIFGAKGLGKIQIPVLITVGSYDPAAPAVFEGIRAFPWLTTPNKFLAMTEGQAHVDFSQLDAGIRETIDSMASLTLPSPTLVDNYSKGMSIAFFGTFVAQRPEYRAYLQSTYALYLSQGQKFKLDFISAASSDKLKKSVESLK